MNDALKLGLFGAALLLLLWKLQPAASEGDETDSAPDLEDYAAQAFEYGASIGSDNSDMNDQNILAFLQGLRLGEGTSDAQGYTRKVGGGNFDSFDEHPALLGWRGWQMPLAMAQAAGFPDGAVSTAAGAYQINKPTWLRVRNLLKLSDFSPASQDAAAIQLIREKAALGDIRMGRINDALRKVRKVWASLPGAGYGQHEVAASTFLQAYQNAGGSIA